MTEKKKQGFAVMDPAKVRELARQGGVAAHVAGTGYEWTPEQAREAGRKGGLKSRRGVAKKKAQQGPGSDDNTPV